MKIYLISGLGADHRAFENLKFPEGYEVVHLPWIKAFPDETLEDYSQRMAKKIGHREPFILGGLSFGGMVAVEISKFLKPEKLLLFSTVASKRELPWYYRLAGQLKIYRFLPKASTRPFLPFLFFFFGPLDDPAKDLLRYFSRSSDPDFLKWALTRIVTWKNTILPECIRINGKLDKAFPVKFLPDSDLLIRDAGHLAVYTHSIQVNRFLSGILTD